jgi:acyl-CoA synthetase (NDP forming)
MGPKGSDKELSPGERGALPIDEARIRAIAGAARSEGRTSLTELEGMDVLDAMGLRTPVRVFALDAAGAARATADGAFPGDRVVVKVVSSKILHKTEVGGVSIVRNTAAAVEAAVASMALRLSGMGAEGYSVNEFVSYEPGLGREIIAGYRFTPDFGPVASLGFGGILAEYLASALRPGSATLIIPGGADIGLARRELARKAVQSVLAGGLRGTEPILGKDELAELALAFARAAPILAAAGILELEVNPFALVKEGGAASFVALDALVKLGDLPAGVRLESGRFEYGPQARRPLAKIGKLLGPGSAAVIGVSEKSVNNGRIILRNLLKYGFEPSRISVVKPGATEIDGCRCVPDVASLPGKVDLFVLAVPATSAPSVLADLVEKDKAESVIVIPGGLEEKQGAQEVAQRMSSALERSRATAGGGPIIVGGNCLGVLSMPGKYDTLFIPEHKLPLRSRGEPDPVALVSQSGAFAITRLSKHPRLAPKYVVTCGNQMDATLGDFLEYLADDESIKVFAVYIEGFKSLDGDKLVRACARIVTSGRTVIAYRAGRSPAGAAASASHTASIAGDYAVARELLSQAGAIVAESLDEFDDALSIFTLLRDKSRNGRRLGALSNAGFECVAMADGLGKLELAAFSKATTARLAAVFEKAGISEIVDPHNPTDLTPMADDEAYEECFRAILDDPGVDCGITGIVPLTAALRSLDSGPDYAGDLRREDGIAARYGRLMAESAKPWVAVVDSGPLYDAFASALESRGVPTFRSADRALAALGIWAAATGARHGVA